MEQENFTSRKKRRGLSKFLTVCSIIVSIALIAVILAIWAIEKTRTHQALAQVSVLEQQLAEKQDEIDRLKETTIPVATFQEYAAQFSPNTEFIQKFFPEQIVYKDATGIVYKEIDPSLEKNSYSWSGLVRKNGRIWMTRRQWRRFGTISCR